MKTILITTMLILLPSCGTIPVAVSYSGAAAGHTYQVGYSGKQGVGIVVNQK